MVTAGVFLLLRSSPLLEASNQGLFLITIIGSLTAFFAASVAIVQNDLKKVIAYSTASQLGYSKKNFWKRNSSRLIAELISEINYALSPNPSFQVRFYSIFRGSGELIDIIPQEDEYVEK